MFVIFVTILRKSKLFNLFYHAFPQHIDEAKCSEADNQRFWLDTVWYTIDDTVSLKFGRVQSCRVVDVEDVSS